MEVHPSQRRLSCEVCKKNKTKCQRMKPDDLKCVRCTFLGVVCDPGQQKKVGRPKRKAPASDPALEDPTTTKRRPKIAKSKPQVVVVNQPEHHREIFLQHLPAFSDRQRAPPQTDINTGQGYQWFTTPVQSSFPPPPHVTTPGFEVPAWPTIMTDTWYRGKLPRAAGTPGCVISDSDSDSSGDMNATVRAFPFFGPTTYRHPYDLASALPSVTDSALFQGSLAWIHPRAVIMPSFPSNYALKQDPDALLFGVKRQATYYVHVNKYSSAPEGLVFDADTSDAMARLVKLKRGLQVRSQMVEINSLSLDLNLMIYRRGPLFFENYSIGEFILEASQDLLQIMTSLLHNQQAHRMPHHELPSYLFPAFSGVYCQVLSFWELFLEHLTARTERVGTDPVAPIPGMTLNGMLLSGPCAQGVLFCNTILNLLERFEHVLGIGSNPGDGLLSTKQINTLWDKLDEGVGLASGSGIMRPSDIKKLYVQVAAVLERLSLIER